MLTEDDLIKIKELLGNYILPIGTIIIFSSKIPPDGFLECDGRWISKFEYQQLYSILGGTFGENDAMFRLPDLRGKFVRGYDSSNRIDPQRIFGDYQDDALQGHTHKTEWSSQETSESGEHSHLFHADHYDRWTNNYNSSDHVHANKDFNNQFNKKTNVAGLHKHQLPDIILGEICSSKYGKIKIGVETRPKNIALTFCIRAN